MRTLSLLVLLTTIFLSACEQGTGDVIELSPMATCQVHDRGEGEKLLADHYAMVHVDARVRDSIVFTTRDSEEPTIVPIYPDSIQDVDDPLLDALRFLSIGDSATVKVTVDSLPKYPSLPPWLESEDYLYYDVRVVDMIDEEELQARQAEILAEMEAAKQVIRDREAEMLEFAAEQQQAYQNNSLENIQETPSGLRYVVHEMGDGPVAEMGQMARVLYIGMLSENGNVFDQSFNRGEAIEFPVGVGGVIKGWDEALAVLPQGSKATLIIPSELAYGAEGTPTGTIPPNSELMFYIEVEEIR